MNEEIEYAEMLEIPVSTVNVVKKKRKGRRAAKSDLKEDLISRVNEKVQEDRRDFALTEERQFSEADEAREIASDYRVDTVILENAEPKKERRSRAGILLTAEFAAACALCGGIFLTNVFMPQSAMNTFFRSLAAEKTEKTEKKLYSDFDLASALSYNVDAEITVSPAGVLSFTNKGHVYPIADGMVKTIAKNADGTYEMQVAYTDDFYGVLSGLNQTYYEVGDSVKANVPVGYSGGEHSVQVTLYSGGALLNCFTVDEEGKPTWLENEP